MMLSHTLADPELQ